MAELLICGDTVQVDGVDPDFLASFTWRRRAAGLYETTMYPPVGAVIPKGKTMADFKQTVYLHRLVEFLNVGKY